MTLLQALKITNRSTEETLAFYHRLVMDELLSKPLPAVPSEDITLKKANVTSPATVLTKLPRKVLEELTSFVNQDKVLPYEGIFPSKVCYFFEGLEVLPYGSPEAQKLSLPSCELGEQLNLIFKERVLHTKVAIGFREIWTQYAEAVNQPMKRLPNVYLSSVSTAEEALLEARLAEPVCVFMVGNLVIDDLKNEYAGINIYYFTDIQQMLARIDEVRQYTHRALLGQNNITEDSNDT